MLGAADGGMGHDRSDGENMPLLAMLAPPTESWLERLATAGDGDLGKPGDKGEMSIRYGLIGVEARLLARAVLITGGPSGRSGGATAGLGCVTGGGSVVP